MEERGNIQRPYWKVIVSLTFSIIGTVLCLTIGIWGLLYFMPFVIGWFISFLAHPVVSVLEKRLKIKRKLGSAIIIIATIAAIAGVGYLAVSKVMEEVMLLIQNGPDLYQQLEEGFATIGKNLQGLYNMLPAVVQESWEKFAAGLDSQIADLIAKFSDPVVTTTGNLVKKIPALLVGMIVMMVSAYFFIAQRDEVITWAKKVAPQSIQKRMSLIIYNLKYAVGGYLKAQVKIMFVVGAILLVGFGLMRIKYAILLAILTAFLDFLPFFGTGAVLWPWALYKLLVGNYKEAICLMIIYAITQLVRQIIQPKLVGDSIGLNPMLTLVLLYVGYKIGGFFGLVLGVPIGMIVINLYKAGAFDYIINDVQILIDGILSLRE